jgi:hypothetical protein
MFVRSNNLWQYGFLLEHKVTRSWLGEIPPPPAVGVYFGNTNRIVSAQIRHALNPVIIAGVFGGGFYVCSRDNPKVACHRHR